MIEGIVVGDFQGNTKLGGFFVQEETADVDADPLTSEGIFVYEGSTPVAAVNVGDLVRVRGVVAEFNTFTELNVVTGVAVCSSGNTQPTPAQVTLPESTNGDLERYEGMYVQITDASNMFVAQNYFVGRYGQLTLAAGQRLYQPTNRSQTQLDRCDQPGCRQRQTTLDSRRWPGHQQPGRQPEPGALPGRAAPGGHPWRRQGQQLDRCP